MAALGLDLKIPKESVLDMGVFMSKLIRVKIAGRQLSGVLKSHDRVGNLVLESSVEHRAEKERKLGVVYIRGPCVEAIHDGKSWHTIDPDQLAEDEAAAE